MLKERYHYSSCLADKETEVGEVLTKVFSTSNEEGIDSLRAEVSTSTLNPLYQFPGAFKGDRRKRKTAKEERGSEGEKGRGVRRMKSQVMASG